jgi:hypothetical protein
MRQDKQKDGDVEIMDEIIEKARRDAGCLYAQMSDQTYREQKDLTAIDDILRQIDLLRREVANLRMELTDRRMEDNARYDNRRRSTTSLCGSDVAVYGRQSKTTSRQ